MYRLLIFYFINPRNFLKISCDVLFQANNALCVYIIICIYVVRESVYIIICISVVRERERHTLAVRSWREWSWRTREGRAPHCSTGRRGCSGSVSQADRGVGSGIGGTRGNG